MPSVGNMKLFSLSTDNPGPLPPAPAAQSIASAVNNVAVSDDSNPGAGDFDGSGNSYSAGALAKYGITAGGKVTVEGAQLTFPSQSPGTANAVASQGQTLSVDDSGHKITLLTASNDGDILGFLRVNYTDGTSEQFPIEVADWFSSNPAPGGSLVASTAWNQRPGNNSPHAVGLYGLTVDTGASNAKTIASITLPSDGRLKVFSAAVH
ncbi:hypothetical protein [Arthrobacter sp. ISL-72]|uniref:hypothetical protein n=1 Tax=Arthrobacter sp. ISL-72 TaxID=2819114 RepID=UPI001BEABE4B|nr:hypothetical protein [Arthrobacter sp. ISL-72]MBT2594977.1 hypothetical protein [Arthrobacter sp. ISL-72]